VNELEAALKDGGNGDYASALAGLRAVFSSHSDPAEIGLEEALHRGWPSVESSELLPLLQAVADSEDDLYALYNLGSALWLLDELQPAVGAFEIAALQGNDAATLALGESRLWMGAEAVAPLRELVDRAGEDHERAAGLLGRAYMGLPNPDWPTITDLLRVAAAEDDLFIPDLARSLSANGLRQQAISELKRARPDDADAAVLLGNIYWEDGQLDAAREEYRRGISLGDAHSAYNLAGLLIENGDEKDGYDWLRWAATKGDGRAIERLASRQDL